MMQRVKWSRFHGQMTRGSSGILLKLYTRSGLPNKKKVYHVK